MICQFALERMQVPTGNIHAIRVLGCIEQRELSAQFGFMRRLNASFATGGEKLLDPLMPEALDHAYSVARHFSLVKQR